jgi:DNA-binding SARP family transcriptional activator
MSEPIQRARRQPLGKANENNKVVSIDRGKELESIKRSRRHPLVRIHLFGAMRATNWLGQDIIPPGRKTRALLGYLCLNSGKAIARSRVAGVLWDRVPDRQANASFRRALLELSMGMGPLAAELISRERDAVTLNAHLCWIDAHAVLSSEPPPPHTTRGDLAALCTGELLEGLDGISVLFDQWLLAERTRFGERLRELLAAELKEVTGADPERQAAAARRVIAFDPTHEGASRLLMRVLANLGERAQALREYERCSEALKAALDVEPSSETRALYQSLRAFSATEKHTTNALVSPTARQTASVPPSFSAHPRLRVEILPFLAHAASAEILALYLSQEIAAGLARFRWFDVIAPGTPQRPWGLAIPPAPLRDNPHYVVEGNLSGNEQKFQISVRLLDVREEPSPVWSDRFDLTATALEEVHESIVVPVVARIDPVILFIEGQHRHSQSTGPNGLVLRAIPLMYSMERRKYEEAGRLIGQALEADPENTNVLAWAAFWQVWHVGQGWAPDAARSLVSARELAVQAIRLDPENAEALGIYAHICAFLDKDFDSAVHYFDRALRLNPSLAFVWALSAPTYCYIGEPDLALQRLDRYRDLAPSDPLFPLWEYFYAIAFFFKGDYEKTVSIGRRAAAANPDFVNGYKPLIAALGHLGRRADAAIYIKKLLALEPGFTVTRFGKVYPFRKQSDRDRYTQGLLLAGVRRR